MSMTSGQDIVGVVKDLDKDCVELSFLIRDFQNALYAGAPSEVLDSVVRQIRQVISNATNTARQNQTSLFRNFQEATQKNPEQADTIIGALVDECKDQMTQSVIKDLQQLELVYLRDQTDPLEIANVRQTQQAGNN